MSNAEIVMLVGGVIAIGLVAVEAAKSGAISLTQAAVIVLGVVFVLLAFI